MDSEWIFEIRFEFGTVLTKNSGFSSVSLKHGPVPYVNFELLKQLIIFLCFQTVACMCEMSHHVGAFQVLQLMRFRVANNVGGQFGTTKGGCGR